MYSWHKGGCGLLGVSMGHPGPFLLTEKNCFFPPGTRERWAKQQKRGWEPGAGN